MTRFARAKGSKASNLKSPEDGTPWEVMKEQLLKSKKDIEESKNREEAEKQRIENYNNFLKEQKTQKRKATWCDFPEAQVDKNVNSSLLQNKDIHKIKKKKLSNKQSTSCIPESNTLIDSKEDIKEKSQKKNKLKYNKCIEELNYDTLPNDTNHTKQNDIQTEQDSRKAKKIKKKKHTNVGRNGTIAEEIVEDNQESTEQQQNLSHIEHRLPKNRKKKNKKKKPNEVSKFNNGIENSINTVENKSDLIENNNMNDQVVQNDKKKKNKQKVKNLQSNEENKESVNNTNDQVNKLESPKKKKDKLKKGNKAVRRKPINDRSFQLIINSKEVELMRFDGFPVMKKDAERLEELKKSMIKKGIPKSEVQRTLKLERRRAEKGLARLKREVCYNCRKGGHNLSDCPELKSNIPGVGAAEGVCFKCGSTEHRQFECKVQRDKEFRFATCFICKESGHIARQCPDNPKGLYPNGGCCKLCGDVTHLRKDCPTVKDNKKEGSTIKLQTLNEEGIEDIGQNLKPVPEETVKKPKKIKF